MKGPIYNAKDFDTLGNSGMPNVEGAFAGYWRPLQFGRITKQTVNFKIVERVDNFVIMGVIQNLSARKLDMKPIGQRSWKWKMIHAMRGTVMNTDDIITHSNVQYRVMEVIDFADQGFMEYHVISDYQGVSP